MGYIEKGTMISIDTAYVWHVKLEANYTLKKSVCWSWLSQDEKNRATCFHFERDCLRFTMARGILRFLLSQFLDLHPETLQFFYSPWGKPSLGNGSPLQFNLSHSQGRAVYAFAWNQSIGVDIEQQNSQHDIEGIARRFFSKREYQALQCLRGKAKVTSFFRTWVQKEALLKAWGCGLSKPLSEVEVGLYRNPSLGEWSLRALSAPPGFSAALAIPSSIRNVTIQILRF